MRRKVKKTSCISDGGTDDAVVDGGSGTGRRCTS